jgi:hypothetical protein
MPLHSETKWCYVHRCYSMYVLKYWNVYNYSVYIPGNAVESSVRSQWHQFTSVHLSFCCFRSVFVLGTQWKKWIRTCPCSACTCFISETIQRMLIKFVMNPCHRLRILFIYEFSLLLIHLLVSQLRTTDSGWWCSFVPWHLPSGIAPSYGSFHIFSPFTLMAYCRVGFFVICFCPLCSTFRCSIYLLRFVYFIVSFLNVFFTFVLNTLSYRHSYILLFFILWHVNPLLSTAHNTLGPTRNSRRTGSYNLLLGNGSVNTLAPRRNDVTSTVLSYHVTCVFCVFCVAQQ